MAYRGSSPDINAPRASTAVGTPAASTSGGDGGGGGSSSPTSPFGSTTDAGPGAASRLLRPHAASKAAAARYARDQADAGRAPTKRETPLAPAQTITKRQAFPPDNAVRSGAGPLARNQMSAAKNRVNKNATKAGKNIAAAIAGTPGGGARLEQINRELAATTSRRSGLKPPVRKAVTALDRHIAAHEAENNREHIVYARAEPSGDPAAFRASVQRVIDNQGTISSDRYIVADHNPAKVPPGRGDMVYEIRTTRGAYLGRTDRTGDSGHLLPRATHLEPVGVKQVQVVGADGKEHTRTVIQCVDSGLAAQERAAQKGV